MSRVQLFRFWRCHKRSQVHASCRARRSAARSKHNYPNISAPVYPTGLTPHNFQVLRHRSAAQDINPAQFRQRNIRPSHFLQHFNVGAPKVTVRVVVERTSCQNSTPIPDLSPLVRRPKFIRQSVRQHTCKSPLGKTLYYLECWLPVPSRKTGDLPLNGPILGALPVSFCCALGNLHAIYRNLRNACVLMLNRNRLSAVQSYLSAPDTI